MSRLFVHHNGRRGEVLLCRAVYRAALARGLDLTIGVCRGDGELFADLEGPTCRVIEGPYRNTVHGAPLDLGVLCPPGAAPIEVWLGGNESEPTYQWPDVVDAFHASLQACGVQARIAQASDPVPMLDFAGDLEVPQVEGRLLWIDARRTACGACHFVFDLERIRRVLPDHVLLCTVPGAAGDRIVDVSALSWPVQSRLSERCEVLVGATLDPFVVTMTEANRWKPKALCGWDARVHAPFWDYPGNPVELLATMDDLVDFLLANAAEVSA